MTTQTDFSTPFLVDRARITPTAVSGTRVAHLVPQIFRSARDRLCAWKWRSEDRAFLAGLQPFELSEMGLTLDQRDSEVRKPFWQD